MNAWERVVEKLKPRVGAPSSVNPGPAATLTAVRVTYVVTTPGQVTKLAGYDPTRVGIGFGLREGAGVVAQAIPMPDGVVGFGFTIPQADIQWFHLEKHTSLVTSEWYTEVLGGESVCVVECYRLPW